MILNRSVVSKSLTHDTRTSGIEISAMADYGDEASNVEPDSGSEAEVNKLHLEVKTLSDGQEIDSCDDANVTHITLTALMFTQLDNLHFFLIYKELFSRALNPTISRVFFLFRKPEDKMKLFIVNSGAYRSSLNLRNNK